MSILYVKITVNHYGGYPYRIGLNTLKHSLDSYSLYYDTLQSIFRYIPSYGDKICILTIPKESKVDVVNKLSTKSDKIIIEKIMPLWTLETIQYLVSIGADIHDNVLKSASANGHLDIVQYFVSMGANIHAGDDYALLVASREGHLDVAQYLVSVGADIHVLDDYALRWASREGHLNVVKYLVSVGANIHALNGQALRWSSENGRLDITEYLQSLYKLN